MKIFDLKLTNFRNHTKLSVDLDDNLTLITGPNGSGKTNILEAIYILATGKSQRARYDKDLIQHKKDFCTIEGNIQTDGEKLNLQIQIQRNERFENVSIKKAKINKVAKSMQYFTGIFNAVLFSPEDIELITDSPSLRRRYLDTVLSQVDIKYKRALNSYTKAVRQRNKLLERISEGDNAWSQIDFWTKQLLENGQLIQETRDKFFKTIKTPIEKNGKRLNTDKTKIEINYIKNEINEERLEEYKNREIAARTTLIGPHRDDFEMCFNSHSASEFGSRGEQRSCVLALKLSELEYIEKVKKEKPVLLLDDIFSELDEKHQQAVLDVIEDQQTTITTTANLQFLEKEKIKTISLPIK